LLLYGEGVAILHAAGIIHRDLQPNHININSKGHPVISGFGSAKILGRPEIPLFKSAVTLSPDMKKYQAPELLLGWAHDFSVDCWAFGILLYLMLCGVVCLFSLPHLR
jgi:serine/threonine protein kinase